MMNIKKSWLKISMVLIGLMHLQDGHGLALHASATETQWAILEEYTSDTCVLRPHLCPNGFTLAFYTKIRPPTGVTTKPTVKESGLLQSFCLLFRFSFLERGKIESELLLFTLSHPPTNQRKEMIIFEIDLTLSRA